MSKLKTIFESEEWEWVDINKIQPNDYNPNYMPDDLYQSLKNDMAADRLQYAIIANKRTGLIIDGYHRWKAAKELGWKQIPVSWRDITPRDAKLMTLRINRERGALMPQETGALLKDLALEIPLDILPKVTDISAPEINLLLDMPFNPEVVQDTAERNQMVWTDVETAISTLVKEINIRKLEFDQIYAVPQGGVIPAKLFADRLGIKKLLIGTKTIPNKTLIVDDIFDTGRTYREIMKIVPDKKDVVFATLAAKKHSRYPRNLIFAELDENDTYLIFPWDRFEYKRGLKK